jgi:hypothetical protein
MVCPRPASATGEREVSAVSHRITIKQAVPVRLMDVVIEVARHPVDDHIHLVSIQSRISVLLG